MAPPPSISTGLPADGKNNNALSAEGARVQGDHQIGGAGPAEVRRLPEPEDVPPETVRPVVLAVVGVGGGGAVHARAEHHGQGGVPVPAPGGGPRQAGRRRARSGPVGRGARPVADDGRRLRAQRVRGRRVDRQVRVPRPRGLTAAAAVNRPGPVTAAAAPPTAGRPTPTLGRTVNRVPSDVSHARARTRRLPDGENAAGGKSRLFSSGNDNRVGGRYTKEKINK